MIEKKKRVRVTSIHAINDTPRRLADCGPAMGVMFKGPMLSFLAAAYAFANGSAGTHSFKNDSIPPLAEQGIDI